MPGILHLASAYQSAGSHRGYSGQEVTSSLQPAHACIRVSSFAGQDFDERVLVNHLAASLACSKGTCDHRTRSAAHEVREHEKSQQLNSK